MNWFALFALLTLHVAGAAAQPVPANTKCAFGVVARVSEKQLDLSTNAGNLALRLPPELRSVVQTLQAGQRVRVYYVISEGALATQVESLQH